MKRDEIEHVLRAPGAITGVSTWVIVGSHAILAPVPSAPEELPGSPELEPPQPPDADPRHVVDGSVRESPPSDHRCGH